MKKLVQVCNGLNCVLKIHVLRSQPTDPQDVNLSENRGIADVIIQVKVRSLEWAQIQYDMCPCKKENFGHRDMHIGRTPCG